MEREGQRGFDIRPAYRRAERPPPASPLVLLAAACALGAGMSAWLDPPVAVGAAGVLAGLTLILLWGRTVKHLALVAAALASLAAGLGLHAAAHDELTAQRGRLEALSGAVELTVRVVGPVDVDDERSRAVVEIVHTPAALDDLRGARLSLGVYDAPELTPRPGELLHGPLFVDGVDPPANPLVPDYGEYLSARGVAGWARSVGGLDRVGEAVGPLEAFLRLRAWLTAHALTPLEEDARGLARALLLGDRSGIPTQELERYRRSGVFHVFAVSGLHVGLVGYLLFALGGALPLRRRGRYLLALVGIAAFTLLTGARPPALRACLMAGIYLGGRLLGRPAHLGTSVAAAGLLLLIVEPLQITDISFQLSFTAAAGIAAFTPKTARWLKRRRLPGVVAEPLAATCGAQLALFPLLALHFSRVPLAGMLLNLLVVPLVGMILLVGLPYLLLAAVWSAAAPLLGVPLTHLLRALDWLVGEALAWAPLTVDVRQPSWWLVLGTLGLLALAWGLLVKLERKRRLWALAPAAVLLTLWAVQVLRTANPEELRLTFFDVARGDCILIESPAGDRILIDGGADWADPAAEYLRRRGIDELDAVVLTHPDEDHCAGLSSVLESCTVERVYRPPEVLGTAAFSEYLGAEAASGAAVIHPAYGTRPPTRDPALNLTVLSNSAVGYPGDDTNNASLVLLLRYGGFSALFTGDLEADGEAALLSRWPGEIVDLLKVPHHGSLSGTTPQLLEALRPGHAVVFPSAGTFDEPVRWRLAEHGCWLYNVGELGAAVLQTDGRRFSLGRFDGAFAPAVVEQAGDR